MRKPLFNFDSLDNVRKYEKKTLGLRFLITSQIVYQAYLSVSSISCSVSFPSLPPAVWISPATGFGAPAHL